MPYLRILQRSKSFVANKKEYIKHAVGMQPEYSTYGTDLDEDFFYKALTPMGFTKCHNPNKVHQLEATAFCLEVSISSFTFFMTTSLYFVQLISFLTTISGIKPCLE
jgi:hypothetical protein